MIITNKTDTTIKIVNTKTGKVTSIKPGKGDYHISVKDSGVSAQLLELLKAGKFFFVIPVMKDKKK